MLLTYLCTHEHKTACVYAWTKVRTLTGVPSGKWAWGGRVCGRAFAFKHVRLV